MEEQLLELLLERAPTLGTTRLLVIDGPSGSGKTTLRDRVVATAEARGTGVAVVHMDDLYGGWDGLRPSGHRLREQLLEPLSQGRPGHHRRYDWLRGEHAEELTVPVTDVLVVEGVGSWRRAHADRVTVLVWVEAPRDVRLERVLRRDGPEIEPELRRWQPQEDALHAEEGTREHADLVVLVP